LWLPIARSDAVKCRHEAGPAYQPYWTQLVRVDEQPAHGVRRRLWPSSRRNGHVSGLLSARYKRAGDGSGVQVFTTMWEVKQRSRALGVVGRRPSHMR
jgi:hypothetical protein